MAASVLLEYRGQVLAGASTGAKPLGRFREYRGAVGSDRRSRVRGQRRFPVRVVASIGWRDLRLGDRKGRGFEYAGRFELETLRPLQILRKVRQSFIGRYWRWAAKRK
jgi:hypothetical protein